MGRASQYNITHSGLRLGTMSTGRRVYVVGTGPCGEQFRMSLEEAQKIGAELLRLAGNPDNTTWSPDAESWSPIEKVLKA